MVGDGREGLNDDRGMGSEGPALGLSPGVGAAGVVASGAVQPVAAATANATTSW